ncbi:MAG: glycosyltransferase family 39 protein [Chloroflexota bacterium]
MPPRHWPNFILLCLFEGLLSLGFSLAIPGEGLSLSRLALAGLIVLILAALTRLYLRSRDAKFRSRWLDAPARPRLFSLARTLASLLLLTSGLLLFLLRYLNPEATADYFARARPFLVYLLLLSAQTLLWLTYLTNGIHPANLRERRDLLRPTALFFCIFILTWLLISLTGLGLTEDPSYWAEPGVPILGWQLILALLLSFLFTQYATRNTLPPRADILISLSLWLLAFALWMSVPLSVLKNSSYAPIQPPSNQPAPASDAILYDSYAQSLLVGNGFLGSIPPRPLYILFLAGLHVIFGQDYGRVILGQTLLLALFPVALYFLAKRLHSRAAGIIVALFAIFRELTSLWVSSDTRVVNSKMLLSDFVTTLALVAYLLLILRWLRDKHGSLFYAFLSGGTLGLMLLLRSQSVFLTPGILLLGLLVLWPDWKKWFVSSVVFGLAMILAVSPWLARNKVITGKASLDDPAQIIMVASMYSGGTPTSNNYLFEGKTPSEISSYVLDTIVHRPGYVAGFVANQFFANTLDALLVLPIFARFDGLTAPVYIYWFDWQIYLTPLNQLLITIYLLLIALGFAAAWKRLRWLGLLPLVLFLTYTFSTSMARLSGWRYIFPADWVPYFYFGLGALELTIALLTLFSADPSRFSTPPFDSPALAPDASAAQDKPEPARPIAPTRPARVILASLAFLLIASLPWIAERALPNHLASLSSDCGCLSGYESEIKTFLAQPGAVTITGRVLYPRYFGRNDGLASANPSPAYAPRDYPRTGFYFLTLDKMNLAVLPMKGARPFPHAADAVLYGCQRDKYVEVKLIIFLDAGLIYTNGSLADSCETP